MARATSPARRTAAPGPRLDLVVFAALLLLPAAGVLGWLLSRSQTDTVEQALLQRATELASRTGARAPHLPAVARETPPSGTALARNLDALLSALRLDDAGDATLRRAGRGQLEPPELPPSVVAALERARPPLLEVLAETRSAEVRIPPEIRFIYRPDGLYSLPVLRRLAASVALEVFSASRGGAGERALGLCLDGLALGRDLSLDAGLLGLEARRILQADLAPACLAALAAATPEAAAAAVAPISSIALSAPSIATTARNDATLMTIEVFGNSLSEDFERSLPKGLPPMVPPEPSALQRWLRRDAIGDVWAVFGETEQALRTPRPDRARAFARVGRAAERRVNPTAAISLLDWGKWDSRDAEAHALLVAVATAAAARAHFGSSGGWPEDARALVAALPSDLLGGARQPELERLADGDLRITVPYDVWGAWTKEHEARQVVQLSPPADTRPTPPPRRPRRR